MKIERFNKFHNKQQTSTNTAGRLKSQGQSRDQNRKENLKNQGRKTGRILNRNVMQVNTVQAQGTDREQRNTQGIQSVLKAQR